MLPATLVPEALLREVEEREMLLLLPLWALELPLLTLEVELLLS